MILTPHRAASTHSPVSSDRNRTKGQTGPSPSQEQDGGTGQALQLQFQTQGGPVTSLSSMAPSLQHRNVSGAPSRACALLKLMWHNLPLPKLTPWQ